MREEHGTQDVERAEARGDAPPSTEALLHQLAAERGARAAVEDELTKLRLVVGILQRHAAWWADEAGRIEVCLRASDWERLMELLATIDEAHGGPVDRTASGERPAVRTRRSSRPPAPSRSRVR